MNRACGVEAADDVSLGNYMEVGDVLMKAGRDTGEVEGSDALGGPGVIVRGERTLLVRTVRSS